MNLTPDWIGELGSVAILAGHYCVSEELEELSASAPAEECSFAVGVTLLQSALRRGSRAKLTIWINDIGIEASTRQAIKENYRLPPNYARTLEDAKLDESSIAVAFESSTRNKASTHVKRLSARNPGLFRRIPSDSEGLIRCVEACGTPQESKLAYVIDGPAGEALVVKDGSHPKCNLILATLFDDASRAIQAQTIVTVFNGIYMNRIRLGMFVGKKLLGLNARFENLYTFEDYTCKRGDEGERFGVPRPFTDEIGVAAGAALQP